MGLHRTLAATHHPGRIGHVQFFKHPQGEGFSLPGGQAVVGTHVGPYDQLEGTYGELMTWVKLEGLELAEGMWEQYVSDPAAEPDPATWRTLIVWPLA